MPTPPLPSCDAPKRIDVILAGARGRVGQALLARLGAHAEALRHRTGLDLRLVAAFDRRGMAFAPVGLPCPPTPERYAPRPSEALDTLPSALRAPGPAPKLFVDCTASDEVAASYPAWLQAGIGVVAANKRANARELAFRRRIDAASRSGEAPYRFETTVGAAIPLLGPLRSLAHRGERVLALRGVLSGSLSFLLERLHAGRTLTAAISEAEALGFTEPDPGDDLRADDLARKLLVLARESGHVLEPEDITVEPFAEAPVRQPKDWRQHLDADEARWKSRIAEAHAAGERWVMLAEVDAHGARVGLRRLPLASPFATLPAGQNLVCIETELQHERPLWLGGPGAGPDVTAAGVLGDIIEAAFVLAARDYPASNRRSVAA